MGVSIPKGCPSSMGGGNDFMGKCHSRGVPLLKRGCRSVLGSFPVPMGGVPLL